MVPTEPQTSDAPDYLPGFAPPAPDPQSAESHNPPHPLAGQTLVITGAIPGFKRKEAAALIQDHGGAVSDTVKPGCCLVWDGRNASKKLRQALRHGNLILEASLLAKMLQQPMPSVAMPAATDPDFQRQAQEAIRRADAPPQGNIDEYLSRQSS